MSEYKDGQILRSETESEYLDPYVPTEKEVTVINRVFERFRAMQEERDKVRHEFDDRTLEQYVGFCQDQYNGIVSDAIKSTKEDWQSLIWDHETRGKVKTIVAMVTGNRPFMSLIGETEEDHDFAKDMLDVYEDSWRKDKGTYGLYMQMLDAAIKGTVVVEEGYLEEEYIEKEITKVDHKTGQISFREVKKIRGGSGHVYSKIVPILDFYPNENSSEIEHDCCVIKQYSKKAFLNKFGKYPNAKYVTAGVWADTFDGCEYQAISQKDNELVEVLRYYNEDWDEFVILANGVWLNKQANEGIAPLPFNHKRLPFAKTVFELADVHSFYGKSMPDLLGGDQETRNALLRLMVDQEILAVNKPILLGMGIEIESYQLYPGKTIKMTGDISQAKELDISGSTQTGFQLLSLLRTSTDVNTSIGPDTQGVHSGRKTAREAVILDENAKRITSTFQVFVYKLLRERAELRIENIKQFYTTKIQNRARKVPVVNPGRNVKWIDIDPKMKLAKFQIRFVEDYETTMNRSTRIELAKAILDESKANPLMNADQATIDYLEALGQNPDKLYLKPKQEELDFQNDNKVPKKKPQPAGAKPMPKLPSLP